MKHQDVIERANKRVKELVDALDVFPANYSAYHNKVESVLLDLNYWWGQELNKAYQAGQESERGRIVEAVESMQMEQAPPFSANDTFRVQAELINKHLMPHIKERFLSLIRDNQQK